MLEFNKIYEGDCLERLKELDDNSIDSIVTDPPYWYWFMWKDWDKAVVSVDVWKECLRCLKPWWFAFIMSAPRQDVLSKMIVNITDAWFKTDFSSIYWTYTSGFPKAFNLSKSVDKKLWKFDERKVISTYKSWIQDWNILNVKNNQSEKNTVNITTAVTEQAKKAEWLYWWFQPKPAVEVVIVAMKPLEKWLNYTEQYLKNGKGCTDIDWCRIPYVNWNNDVWNRNNNIWSQWISSEPYYRISSDIWRFPSNLISSDNKMESWIKTKSYKTSWSCKNNFTFSEQNNNEKKILTEDEIQKNKWLKNESNSTNKYFDLDLWFEERLKQLPENIQKTFPFMLESKPQQKEKNKGLENLESKKKYVAWNYSQSPVCIDCNKTLNWTNNHNNCSWKVYYKEMENSTTKNIHPTVKPIKLMSYLIVLWSRTGDTILDPFSWSGSTLIAAKINDRNYIWFDITKEYIDIAEARLKAF